MSKLIPTAMLAAGFLLAAPTDAADVAAGKARAADSCVDCHGDDGKGDDGIPSVVGMSVEKFTQAMQEYQNGTRTQSARMAKEAKKLSAAEIANLAAYYATLQ